MIAGTSDAVESVKAIMLGKYKMKDLGKIHLILGCEVLYDEATGDYSMNQRHYVIDLCKKYLPIGGARVQTPMSEETLTKEISSGNTTSSPAKLNYFLKRNVRTNMLIITTHTQPGI